MFGDDNCVKDEIVRYLDKIILFISSDGIETCSTIRVHLILNPASRFFVIVVTRYSFIATDEGIINNFFVRINCSSRRIQTPNLSESAIIKGT